MGTFTPTDNLKEYIDKKEYENIRICLGNLIFSDRSFEDGKFAQALEYVKKELGEDIYENYDNKGLIYDSNITIDDRKFGEAVAKLKSNFCIERIDDVKKISEKLYQNKKKVINQNSEKIEKLGWILLAIWPAATVMAIIEIVKVINQNSEKIEKLGWILLAIWTVATVVAIVEIVEIVKNQKKRKI